MAIGMTSNERSLLAGTQTLVVDGKGLLAMDESNPTCNKRFAAHGIPQTEEMRRAYREMIGTTPHLGDEISGAILYDEMIRRTTADGRSFELVLAEAGIIPGIKVDMGAKDLAAHPGEKITEGLDGLRERLAEYLKMGARFAKWRAVFAIGDYVPSRSCIEANAHCLAHYAALWEEAGLVPIVEPEAQHGAFRSELSRARRSKRRRCAGAEMKPVVNAQDPTRTGSQQLSNTGQDLAE
jgi:fructose-bisphosphate aldolase class I